MILGIFCAGSLGKNVYDLAMELNSINRRWEKYYFIDNIINENLVYNTEVMRFTEFRNRFNDKEAEIIIASGEPNGRKSIYEQVKEEGYYLPTLIHPNAYAPSRIQFGEGIVVLWGAYLSASDLKIGNNVVIMVQAHLSHNCSVGDHSVISSAATISGNCNIGKFSYIGLNSSIREKTNIGDNSIIGLGAVVVRDVPDNAVVAGNPAKIIRNNDTKIVFK